MRFFSLFLAFCLSLNVMAGTGSIQAFEKALDTYQYELSVEWDQKDQTFYEAKTKEFFTKIDKLIKEEGLTQNEIITLMEKKANNPALINALKLKLSLLKNGASTEELLRAINESSKEIYDQGASWNGQVISTVVGGLIIAAIIGYAIWFDSNYKCAAYETRYACETKTCNTPNTYVYDPYYGGYYNCFGGSYTVCGYREYCTDYVKR